MLRFEACASFDLLHSEALHLRRPAVLCGQPKNCGQARHPPPPAPPQCGALSPKRLLVPSLPLYLLLFAQGSPPPSLRHAQRMQSALTKGWNRLGPFGAAKLPVNLTIQNTGASSPPPPPGPPFFFMARALFPARPPPASSLHQQALPTPPMCFKFMLCGAMQAAQARAT